MKTLVVYYSRTGNTRKLAEMLKDTLKCNVEEIIDTQKRSGVLGFLRSGREARNRGVTVLEDIKNDPADFDLLIIGTPIWGGTISTPVRTYIIKNQEKFKNVAFFCTANGPKFDGTINEMKELCKITPLGTLGVRAKEIKDGSYKLKVEKFIKEIEN